MIAIFISIMYNLSWLQNASKANYLRFHENKYTVKRGDRLMKKTLLLLMSFALVLVFSVNSFALTAPKVSVNAPSSIEKNKKFYIDVDVSISDSNRIDSVTVAKLSRAPKVQNKALFKPADHFKYSFGPASISKNTTFKVVVKYDKGRGMIVKNVTVKVKR